MKRLLSLPYLGLMIFLCTVTAAADDNAITINSNTYSGSSFIENGTTYIALRSALSDIDRWEISWDGASQSATAKSETAYLSVSDKRNALTVNGVAYSADVRNINGTLYLPIRIMCNALDYSVKWDSASRSVTVEKIYHGTYSEADVYWLSRVIYAESGAESLTGQIAVGNVVLNRVNFSVFPNNIYDVVFDKKDAVQFEPVSNGSIYNTPSPQSVHAARLALSGESVVGSCMYFYSPSLSAGTWITNNCTYYATIGCHRFYK